MDLEYTGRRVLVVGGSYGIGQAAARQMAGEGARVAIASRSAENLATAAASIAEATGTAPATIVADVTQPGSGQALANAALAALGGIDAVVCAVGGSIRSSFADLTEDQWLQNYTFNILSTVRVLNAMRPHLAAGRAPAVALLGAAASKMPYEHQVVSNTHKAGLLGLNKTLAAEWAGDGIRVNLVAPGRTLTPLWTKRADGIAADKGTTRDAVLEEFSKDIPMRRFGTADEVARMVVWLCSPCASYITGQSVNVDGGIARGLL